MDETLATTWVRVNDDAVPQEDGSTLRERKYVFKLGKFGPFTERVNLKDFDDGEIGRRIAKLRDHLRAAQQA